MNLREVLHIVGALVVWTGAAMVPAAAVGATEGLLLPWALTAAGTVVAGVVLWRLSRAQLAINPREGVAIVGIGWIAVVTAGAVPFLTTA